jgi:hypothetical protein
MLKISWTEKRTNKEILQQLRMEENWLLNNIAKRKLKYFGHIKRHNSLEKTIMEGSVDGKRRRGRPRRRWHQDITESLKMSTHEANRLAQDRDAFREAVKGTTFWREYVT